MPGIGDFLGFIGKIGDYLVPNKKESLRNQIDKLKKEMDNYVVANKPTWNAANALKYADMANKLLAAENAFKNI